MIINLLTSDNFNTTSLASLDDNRFYEKRAENEKTIGKP